MTTNRQGRTHRPQQVTRWDCFRRGLCPGWFPLHRSLGLGGICGHEWPSWQILHDQLLVLAAGKTRPAARIVQWARLFVSPAFTIADGTTVAWILKDQRCGNTRSVGKADGGDWLRSGFAGYQQWAGKGGQPLSGVQLGPSGEGPHMIPL